MSGYSHIYTSNWKFSSPVYLQWLLFQYFRMSQAKKKKIFKVEVDFIVRIGRSPIAVKDFANKYLIYMNNQIIGR